MLAQIGDTVRMDAAERLSGVDRAWLLMDRPANPMTIVGLLLLQRPLAIKALRALINERFLRFARFRCVPVLSGSSAEWRPCASFDIRPCTGIGIASARGPARAPRWRRSRC